MEEPQIGLVPFEEKLYFEGAFARKGVFIDGELFDWGIDEQEYNLAMKYADKHGEHFRQKILADIEKHFVESLSEFMGRRVSVEEVQEARKTGWIKK